ncbi:carbohydrate ABC transporter permease [Paenibacillus mendelii]|uniref:Carbohydrate ABC transporter permease n=1 Tax=Paenibacillus mendelii TaxID=206163 RepID=A0ABV6JA68_9BACL|nr:sugar ABC transporter permease [Paenibacillus mendelii]MCQ6562129.1 sugar ABC transporter permease [Paenibacillus mendelii]
MSGLNEGTPTNKMSLKEHARQKRAQSARSALTGYMFLLPWFIGVLCFMAYPMIYSLYLSFHKLEVSPDGNGLLYTFVGWDNFKYAFLRDNVFPIEMFNFWRETILIIPVTVLFALIVAILLNQKFRGRMIFRAIFFLPVIFATGKVLMELFAQGQGDLPFAEQYDLTKIIYDTFPPALAEPMVGVLNKIILVLWYSGVQVIIFLAAFKTISPSTYEAAQIDGVTPWESFWKITFPAIVPFIFLNLIYTLVDLSTYSFNPIVNHILSNMINLKTGYGYASALGWIYFVIIFLLVALLARVSASLNQRKG